MLAKRLFLAAFTLVGGLWAGTPVQAQTLLDVFESPDLLTPFGLIETIATPQTGAEHYNYVGIDGFPTGVTQRRRQAFGALQAGVNYK